MESPFPESLLRRAAVLYCQCYQHAASLSGQNHEVPNEDDEEEKQLLMESENQRGHEEGWPEFEVDEDEDEELADVYNKAALAYQFVWKVAGRVLCEAKARCSKQWLKVAESSFHETFLGTTELSF